MVAVTRFEFWAVQAGKQAKFVESVEVAMRLGIDPRRGDQMVRGVTSLPHGTGKEPKVAIFTNQGSDLAARAGGWRPLVHCFGVKGWITRPPSKTLGLSLCGVGCT